MRGFQGEMLRPSRAVFIQKVGRMNIGVDSVNSTSAETILMSMFRLIEFFQHTFVQQNQWPMFLRHECQKGRTSHAWLY